ncbi:MBL fold metallo-hydrolase [Hyphomonas pacifica]|uniref:Uncharacterized protein n=1 Tax=Hyphomonas pacifica TaxID=1280941 RepID=A0A062U033_9PROT|nr:hypothetical protein [Hyphomonas pacifica]KCZ47391.1 hypothetical protein HY2_04560 [Hyphomonas pacifica]RAN31307.1 hypothetical protein HY3_04255 [Hyphomonas pacifica]RAN38367.1 hypothetical protein HY11_00720 [Hyphomonas pacifica]
MRWKELLLVAMASVCVACGEPARSGDEPAVQAVTKPQVKSTDFAILPCKGLEEAAPCALVMAGGKRVLFGAPGGIGRTLSRDDVRNMDAVMLFSLRSEGSEGLDEIRNASWRAGHEGSLPVSGPSGTGAFIGALNLAYEVSDALTFVEDRPAGGFDAALLALLPGEDDERSIVFNTGDLQVTKIESRSSRAGYWVDYEGHRVVLEPCGANQAEEFAGAADLILNCESGWPLKTPKFVIQG